MNPSSLPSLIRKGAENLIKNWMTALPTVLVIAIVLTLFHGLIIMHDKAQTTMQAASQKFSITIYLKDSADPFDVGNVITELEKRQDVVAPVTYTSKEAAWELMSKTFSLDTELLKKYKFSLPASLTIMPKSPEDAPKIEAFLETDAAQVLADPAISQNKQKNITRQMLEFVQNIKNTTQRTLVFFILLFVIGGALLMSSTIHLAISSRRMEINIMKLVGASYTTIATPFIAEGVLLCVFAFAIHTLLIFILPLDLSNIKLHLNALLFEFIAVLLLGGIVSHFTTVLHIRKKNIWS